MEIKISLFVVVVALMVINAALTHLLNWFYRNIHENEMPIFLPVGIDLIRWILILAALEWILKNMV